LCDILGRDAQFERLYVFTTWRLTFFNPGTSDFILISFNFVGVIFVVIVKPVSEAGREKLTGV
jgi:hypothetical protein